MRRLFISAISFALLVFLISACRIGNDSTPVDITEGFIPDLNNTKLQERLGEDDGYSFAILYSSDIHGSLEPCG
jgi:hypothetical protein